MARAIASICNDEQGCFGVMSGHERKPLTLSAPDAGQRRVTLPLPATELFTAGLPL